MMRRYKMDKGMQGSSILDGILEVTIVPGSTAGLSWET